MPPWHYHAVMIDKKLYPTRLAGRLIVRFPDEMHERAAIVARESGRSMNAEVVARLQASFAPRQTQDLVGLARQLDGL